MSFEVWAPPAVWLNSFITAPFITGSTLALEHPAAKKTTQNIKIYATDGRIVLNKTYEVSQPYQLHQMDLHLFGSGIYYVVLSEANGNKIKMGEVVVR